MSLAAVCRAPGTLTAFGREAVREMERLSIAIDLSHASERLFYAVAEQTSGPLVASHSDSRTLCSHPRNLTDEQFCLIRDRGGLVGLNFCPDFLRNGGNAGIEDLYRHAEHFLSLGGEMSWPWEVISTVRRFQMASPAYSPWKKLQRFSAGKAVLKS